MNITLLSASTGNGHTSAARALEEVFKREGDVATTYDTLAFAPWAFRKWYGNGYEFIVRTKPELYGHLYEISDEVNASFKIQTASDYVFLSKLRKLLQRDRPDWVVCTHSLAQPRIARLRKEMQNFKVAVVLTDVYPHLMWLRGEPDHFFVPTEYSKELLIKRRPHFADRITVTGIPVHPVFGQEYSKEDFYQNIGCDPKRPVITMTSGGIGGGPFEGAIRELLKLDFEFHLEVICGRNERKRKQVEKAISELTQGKVTVSVRGQIPAQEMALRMARSVALISKPGGLTTSECLAIGCPMLIYEPFIIPGQEEGNADFLVESKVGLKSSTASDLAQQTLRLLQNPERSAEMRTTAKTFGRPDAAEAIVHAIHAMSPQLSQRQIS